MHIKEITLLLLPIIILSACSANTKNTTQTWAQSTFSNIAKTAKISLVDIDNVIPEEDEVIDVDNYVFGEEEESQEVEENGEDIKDVEVIKDEELPKERIVRKRPTYVPISEAVLMLSIPMCDKVKPSDRPTCKDEVYHTLATQNSDINACNQIKDKTKYNSCIEGQTLILINSSSSLEDCVRIENYDQKSLCIAQMYLREWKINKLTEKVCNAVNENSVRENCFDNYYYYITQTSWWKENAYCSSIVNTQMRGNCNDIIAGYNTTLAKEKELEMMKNDGSNSDIVIEKECELTKSGLDIDICIKDNYIAEWIKNKDDSICNKIENESYIMECKNAIESKMNKDIFAEAMRKKDVSICNNITKASSKDMCKQMVK